MESLIWVIIASLAIWIAISGKPGSVLGALIDPGSMVDSSSGTGKESMGAKSAATTLSYTQLVSLAQKAGFSGENALIAAGIAMAESGGQTTAVHTNTNGTVDRGLWQINSVHSQYSGSKLLSDPLYNAKAALSISGGSNFRPWVVFQTGAYLKYL